MKWLTTFLLVLFNTSLYAQVGIGTPLPNESAILDIVSSDKGVLFPRVKLSNITDTLTIQNGNIESLIVYNTTNSDNIKPGFYYWTAENRWFKLNTDETKVFSGSGTPPSPPNLNTPIGSLFVSLPLGNLYTFDGANWLPQSGVSSDSNNVLTNGVDGKPFLNTNAFVVDANNGLTNNNNIIQLGGALTKPTEIISSPSNTLALTGLENGDMNQDQVVTVNPTTGVLSKTAINLLFQENVELYIATSGQTDFPTPIEITDIKKVNVYRNGVRIDATAAGAQTVKLETGVVCFAGDEIRIVQFK